MMAYNLYELTATHLFQIKVHLLELHRRLAEAELKRDNLKNELNNRMDPQEERENLLRQVPIYQISLDKTIVGLWGQCK